MGDIADGILNGDFDEITGEYIGPGKGIPRTLQKSGYNKKSSKYGGIVHFLKLNGKSVSQANKVIANYGHNILNMKKQLAGEKNNFAETMEYLYSVTYKIQKDFNSFREWFYRTYKP